LGGVREVHRAMRTAEDAYFEACERSWDAYDEQTLGSPERQAELAKCEKEMAALKAQQVQSND
jgi:hypothetical protein